MLKRHTHKDGKFFFGGKEQSVNDMLRRLNGLEKQNAVMCGTPEGMSKDEQDRILAMFEVIHGPDE